MTSIVDHLLNVRGVPVYVIVGLLVFAEDALFVGFVIPGETAAVLGGVIASCGHVHYPLIAAVAVFLGRFVAFFRAAMPVLAGTSRRCYPKRPSAVAPPSPCSPLSCSRPPCDASAPTAPNARLRPSRRSTPPATSESRSYPSLG